MSVYIYIYTHIISKENASAAGLLLAFYNANQYVWDLQKKNDGTTPLWRVMPGNCFYAKMTALFTRAITIYPEVAKKMETVDDSNQERWGY